MFYQHSNPVHFNQHLQNILASIIIKTGQLLGLLWFKPSSDGRTYTSFSKSTQIWLITVTSLHRLCLIYMPYYMNFFRYKEYGSNDLSEALVTISDVFHSALGIIMYGNAFFRRKYICKLVYSSNHFLTKCPGSRLSVEHERKCLSMHLTMKMILDLCLTLLARYRQ